MDKVGLPKGLIRYASENEIAESKKFSFTGRMKAYSAVLVLLVSGLSFMLATRDDVDVTLMRAKGMLFQEVGTDSLSNLYQMTLVNKTHKEATVEIKVENFPATLKFIGHSELKTAAEGQSEATFFIVLPKSAITSRDSRLELGIYQNGEKIATRKTSFLGYTE
jgi:polyferredoxin